MQESNLQIFYNYYEECSKLADPLWQTARWDVVPLQHTAICSDIARKLELTPEAVVVDVGCGNGLIDAHLAKKCGKVIGVDLSESELSRARQNTANLQNVRFLPGDASNIPLPDNYADRVLMYGVTMHLEPARLRAAFTEMIRVCKTGGLILIGDNIDQTRWEKCRNRQDLSSSFSDYCAQNPDNLSFISARVITFHFARKLQGTIRKLLNPALRIKEPVVKPFQNIAHEENDMVEMAESFGQKASILAQDFRLPYARYRFDLLLNVVK